MVYEEIQIYTQQLTLPVSDGEYCYTVQRQTEGAWVSYKYVQ